MKRILKEIVIYPIKSLGGVSVSEWHTTNRGLEHDRRWMLIDDKNQFLTIRQQSEFLFFKLYVTKNGFNILHKNTSKTLAIPFMLKGTANLQAKIWDDEVMVIAAPTAMSEWFTKQLGFDCQLVYIPDNSPRRVQPDWVTEEHHVSLADAYPILLAGQNSLADLNSKMEAPITMQRFRPNLIFEGGEPYEEFIWTDITIGTAKLKGIKPCTRCIVTTLNPETAEKGKEPLKTLFKQRINDKMVFGQNTIITSHGKVSVGDEIIISSVKQSPYERA